MKGNLILIHGGGPTAVINASLAGAIRQAQKEPNVDRILAAIGGTGGLIQGHVRDLTDISEAELAMLERTPGSAIGTSRDALEAALSQLPALAVDPETKQRSVYPQYFIDALESAGGIEWAGAWHTTQAGKTLLDS